MTKGKRENRNGHVNKKIEIKDGKLVYTEEQEIDMGDVESVDDAKKQIEQELANIVRQVKALKARADELKAIREQLDVK